ncbi:MAG: hypothetical protein ABS68_13175 [Niastella sp. SCN 39-18]|nr:hypothetical protein [Sphingobacteriales bacterium]ODT51465.1 MAG: hypothetical protein ABS68_13175 [Niastella sp. SCN 39-18]OJW08164.1 MAG: hypothetical protein BGO53_04755 [Sphingobacteriales bacterium 39-19]
MKIKILFFIFVSAWLLSACKKEPLTDSPGNGNDNSIGEVMFWQQADQGQITVTCGGQTQVITSYYYNGAPSVCGASGCATFSLNPGTYNYTANSNSGSWSGTIVITSNGCNRIQLTGGNNNGGGNISGRVMFWQQTNQGQISVTCAGQTQVISSYFSGGAPSTCGTSGCATFSLNPGTYNYIASSSSGSWSGTAVVTANGCNRIQLTGGNGGGGGGGYNSVANVTFWVASDLGCGNITVSCGGTTHTITSFYGSGAPSCGASGTATFLLPTGNNIPYSASCNGLSWSGNVIPPLTGPPCLKVQLTH